MLAGRQPETAAIDALLDRARAGEGGALALVGEPGIGKTSLLGHAAERAGDFTILQVLGVESEAELPYAALHQLLRPLPGAELPPAVAAAFGSAGGAPADRFAVGVKVLELLADAAEARPLLCLLDDAQWFDQESAAVLGFVARRLRHEGVALLFASRAPVAAGVPELAVGRLAADTARAVLIAAFGTASDTVLASAEGNPLALLELAEREREGASRPSSVERSFLERIAALPEASRTALLVAAAADSDELGAIAAAADRLGAGVAALEPAELAGLVRLDTARVAFRHPLVRSAALAAASFHARQRAHRALADALTADEDADRRAWHLAAASIGVDDDIAGELARAAERARARGGYAAAALALERAAERTSDAARRRRWLVEAGEMAWSAGRFERATELLDRAGELPEADVAARAAGVRGAIALVRGDTAQALELHLGAVRPGSPAALGEARLALEAAALGGHFARAPDIRDAARACEADEDRRSFIEGLAAMLSGDVVGAAPALARALEQGERSADIRQLSAAAAAAAYLGRPHEAHRLFARAVAQARAAGAAGVLALMLQYAAMMELWLGGLADAEADAVEALELARETEQVGVEAVLLAVLASVAALRGEADRCRTLAADALGVALPRGIELAVSAAGYALGLLELGQGDPAAAYDRLADVAGRPGAHPVFRLMSVPELAEAAARTGRAGTVAEAMRGFEAWAGATQSPWTLALAARARALTGPEEQAGACFEAALRLHDRVPGPLLRARTELLYGEHLRRLHRRRDARAHLRAAREAFAGLGATPWAARAAAELRAAGETTGPRPEPDGADALTPQELQVARLVGGGATNRDVAAQLFVSPKTVEYHLAKVFRKLGIASRTELVKLDTRDLD